METALRDAGVEGDDLQALVDKVVADLTADTDAKNEADRKKNIADMAAAYKMLSAMLTSDPVATTDILQQGSAPKDAMGGDTQEDPMMVPWVSQYESKITLNNSPKGRDQGNMSMVVVGGVVTTDGDGMRTAPGTFDGVAGTLSCEGSGCDLVYDDDGMVTSTGDTSWTFKPTGGDLVDLAIKDADYVSFSYWVKDSMFHVSYMGHMGTGTDAYTMRQTFTSTTDKVMTATYSGPAGGMYVERDAGGEGTSGNFTADAMLSATLQDKDETAGTLQTTVSGSISNFMDGEKTPLGAMTLMLDKNKMEPDSGVFSGTTSSENDSLSLGSGMWQASFYGGAATETPKAGAGAFNFSWGLGAVAGGFAVEADEADAGN